MKTWKCEQLPLLRKPYQKNPFFTIKKDKMTQCDVLGINDTINPTVLSKSLALFKYYPYRG